MENCLVTKLKGTVSGDLKKLGEMRLNVNTASGVINFKIRVIEETQIATIVGDGHFTDSTGAQDLGKTANLATVDTQLYLSPGSYYVSIPNKYKIDYFNWNFPNNTVNNAAIDINEFNGLGDLNSADNVILTFASEGATAVSGLKGDLGKLNIKNVRYLTIPGGRVSGDISELTANNPSLISLNVENSGAFPTSSIAKLNTYKGDLEGDIALAAEKLEVFEYSRDTSKAFGTVEGFVAAAPIDGSRNNRLVFTAINYNNVTYNGQALNTYAVNIFTRMTFTWDENRDISYVIE